MTIVARRIGSLSLIDCSLVDWGIHLVNLESAHSKDCLLYLGWDRRDSIILVIYFMTLSFQNLGPFQFLYDFAWEVEKRQPILCKVPQSAMPKCLTHCFSVLSRSQMFSPSHPTPCHIQLWQEHIFLRNLFVYVIKAYRLRVLMSLYSDHLFTQLSGNTCWTSLTQLAEDRKNKVTLTHHALVSFTIRNTFLILRSSRPPQLLTIQLYKYFKGTQLLLGQYKKRREGRCVYSHFYHF